MPQGAVEFRGAEIGDGEALVVLRILAMRESRERIGRFDPVRAGEPMLSAFSPQPTPNIVVAGERTGFVVVRPEGEMLLLDHLYIDPRFQNRGIGAAVLAMVFAEADARQLPLKVGALRGSDSNRFYLRHGFRLVKEDEWDNYYIRPAKADRGGGE